MGGGGGSENTNVLLVLISFGIDGFNLDVSLNRLLVFAEALSCKEPITS